MAREKKVVPIEEAQGNRAATWNDLQDLRRGLQGYVDVKVDDLKEYCDKRFDTLEGRFDNLEGRFDALEGKVDTIIKILQKSTGK